MNLESPVPTCLASNLAGLLNVRKIANDWSCCSRKRAESMEERTWQTRVEREVNCNVVDGVKVTSAALKADT